MGSQFGEHSQSTNRSPGRRCDMLEGRIVGHGKERFRFRQNAPPSEGAEPTESARAGADRQDDRRGDRVLVAAPGGVAERGRHVQNCGNLRFGLGRLAAEGAHYPFKEVVASPGRPAEASVHRIAAQPQRLRRRAAPQTIAAQVRRGSIVAKIKPPSTIAPPTSDDIDRRSESSSAPASTPTTGISNANGVT